MDFDAAVSELDTLIGTLEREGDERALLLLELIDAIHRPAIELILNGEPDHPVAHAVLSMYGFTDVDDRVEVEEALDGVRPYIESHGGGLKLLDVEDGVVHIEMSGSCHGCAASAMTLKRGIEEALRENYPNFKEVVAHDPEGEEVTSEPANGGGPQLLQIEGLKKPVFVDAGTLDDLEDDELKAIDVDGNSILLAKVDGEPYAFRNQCALDGRSELQGGRISQGVIVCPWHNCPYDARSGRRVDNEPDAKGLTVVPVAVRDGELKVAVNVA
ncbi:MAG: NifU family protein [Actinomycetota bacterium]|nr:NifU family protein [Actinomycetota bacterium]